MFLIEEIFLCFFWIFLKFFCYKNDKYFAIYNNNNNSNIKDLHISFLIVFCIILSSRKKIKVMIYKIIFF